MGQRLAFTSHKQHAFQASVAVAMKCCCVVMCLSMHNTLHTLKHHSFWLPLTKWSWKACCWFEFVLYRQSVSLTRMHQTSDRNQVTSKPWHLGTCCHIFMGKRFSKSNKALSCCICILDGTSYGLTYGDAIEQMCNLGWLTSIPVRAICVPACKMPMICSDGKDQCSHIKPVHLTGQYGSCWDWLVVGQPDAYIARETNGCDVFSWFDHHLFHPQSEDVPSELCWGLLIKNTYLLKNMYAIFV